MTNLDLNTERKGCCQHFKLNHLQTHPNAKTDTNQTLNQLQHIDVQSTTSTITPAIRKRKQHASDLRDGYHKWLTLKEKFNVNKRLGIAFSTRLSNTPYWLGTSQYHKAPASKRAAYYKTYRLEIYHLTKTCKNNKFD